MLAGLQQGFSHEAAAISTSLHLSGILSQEKQKLLLTPTMATLVMRFGVAIGEDWLKLRLRTLETDHRMQPRTFGRSSVLFLWNFYSLPIVLFLYLGSYIYDLSSMYPALSSALNVRRNGSSDLHLTSVACNGNYFPSVGIYGRR
jgi:hypothetical protein